MASILDAFNEAFADNMSIAKFAIYAVPVYFCAQFFIKGQMSAFYTLTSFTAILLLGMMTCVINNVRENRQVVIPLNPLHLIWVTAKTAVAITPIALVCWFIGYWLFKIVPIPEELGNLQVIIQTIVWVLLGAILLTSYLSYAKFLQIRQAYNLQAISDSCIDVLVNLFFFVPQLALVNVILLAPIWYIFYFFHISFEHWIFAAYISMVIVVNISIIGNYYAQAAYEIIKGRDGDYDNKHDISFLDIDDQERGN